MIFSSLSLELTVGLCAGRSWVIYVRVVSRPPPDLTA
jgi:hypothetical protein